MEETSQGKQTQLVQETSSNGMWDYRCVCSNQVSVHRPLLAHPDAGLSGHGEGARTLRGSLYSGILEMLPYQPVCLHAQSLQFMSDH